MKRGFIITSLVVLSFTSFAQYSTRVVAKWAPVGLYFGKIGLGTEVNFKKKQSINFNIGIPFPATRSVEYDNKKSDIESKAFSLMAGYRFYIGKKAGAGFYAEPYIKYLRHEANGILEGDLDSKIARMDTRTEFKAFGAGLQFGYQFIIAKRICFDLFLLGPEANNADFKSKSTDIANSLPWTLIQTTEAEREIKDAIKDIPILKDKLQISTDQASKSVSTSYSGFLPGFRIGASIGIVF
jgi:hypothetical protein